MSDEHGAETPVPGGRSRGTRRRILASATPIALLALVITWCIAAGAGDDAADGYLQARSSLARLQPGIAVAALADDRAVTSILGTVDFEDPEQPVPDPSAAAAMCQPPPPLPPAPDVAPLADVRLGGISAAYVEMQAAAASDAAALDASDDLVAATPQFELLSANVCTTVSSLLSAHHGADAMIDDQHSLGTLAFIAPEGMDLSYSVQAGTSLLTPLCDGVVGCGQVDFDGTEESVSEDWMEWAGVVSAYADAYRACPLLALSDACAAYVDLYDQRALDEVEISHAYLSGSQQQIEAAFQVRDAHWSSAHAAVDTALDDLESTSFEAAMQSAWVDETTTYAELADAASMTDQA